MRKASACHLKVLLSARSPTLGPYPGARILHPWPQERFAVKYPRWEPSAQMGPARLCAGGAQWRSVMSVPTAISEMSSQIIPLKARGNSQDPSRIPAMETNRV